MAIKSPKLAAIVNFEPAEPKRALSCVLRELTPTNDMAVASGIPESDVPHAVDAALKLESTVAADDK